MLTELETKKLANLETRQTQILNHLRVLLKSDDPYSDATCGPTWLDVDGAPMRKVAAQVRHLEHKSSPGEAENNSVRIRFSFG